jgi:hypothetical protein
LGRSQRAASTDASPSSEGLGQSPRLGGQVPDYHWRGGQAQLAQSQYRRHIEERPEPHLEAVWEALGTLVQDFGIEQIVMDAWTPASSDESLPRR